MQITVYLGSTPGNDPALETAVRALGTWIGTNGHDLVYGGSRCGLMGMLAESVLAAGGRVTGVEPKFFVDAGFVYDAITKLYVTNDMSERKAKMIELGDAFIAFPGGTGTLEEIADDIEQELQSNLEREISTVAIGEMVMARLKTVDEVAYVRFASVYRSFKDINTFMEELTKLLTEK